MDGRTGACDVSSGRWEIANATHSHTCGVEGTPTVQLQHCKIAWAATWAAGGSSEQRGTMDGTIA